MTGSRGPRCPGPTSRRAPPAWRWPGRCASFAAAASSHGPVRGPADLGVRVPGPVRAGASRASAASTRDCRASGPPAASSRREASRSRSSSSAFCAPDLCPRVWRPSAARASVDRVPGRPAGVRRLTEALARPDRTARCARVTRRARAGSRPAPRWRRRVRRGRCPAPAGSARRRPRGRGARWPPAPPAASTRARPAGPAGPRPADAPRPARQVPAAPAAPGRRTG